MFEPRKSYVKKRYVSEEVVKKNRSPFNPCSFELTFEGVKKFLKDTLKGRTNFQVAKDFGISDRKLSELRHNLAYDINIKIQKGEKISAISRELGISEQEFNKVWTNILEPVLNIRERNKGRQNNSVFASNAPPLPTLDKKSFYDYLLIKKGLKPEQVTTSDLQGINAHDLIKAGLIDCSNYKNSGLMQKIVSNMKYTLIKDIQKFGPPKVGTVVVFGKKPISMGVMASKDLKLFFSRFSLDELKKDVDSGIFEPKILNLQKAVKGKLIDVGPAGKLFFTEKGIAHINKMRQSGTTHQKIAQRFGLGKSTYNMMIKISDTSRRNIQA